MGPARQQIEHDDAEDPGELLNYVEHTCSGRDAMVQAVKSKVTGWFGGYYPVWWQYRPHDDPNAEWCDFELETCCFIVCILPHRIVAIEPLCHPRDDMLENCIALRAVVGHAELTELVQSRLVVNWR